MADKIERRLKRIEHLLWQILHKQESEINYMKTTDELIADMQAEATRGKTLNASVLALITGFVTAQTAAIAAAKTAGASDAQLKALTDLSAAMKTNDDDLAGAVAAGTPAAPIADLTPTPAVVAAVVAVPGADKEAAPAAS